MFLKDRDDNNINVVFGNERKYCTEYEKDPSEKMLCSTKEKQI